jgi:hypothetical protein
MLFYVVPIQVKQSCLVFRSIVPQNVPPAFITIKQHYNLSCVRARCYMSLPVCEICKKEVNYVHTEADLVCLECGCCISNLWGYDYNAEQDTVHRRLTDHVFDRNFSRNRYLHAVYFREHCRYLFLVGPTVPDDLFEIIEKEASKSDIYGPIDEFSKIHIKLILSRCVVPTDLQEKYRSKPRPQNRQKDTLMRTLSRFSKKWRWIIWKLLDCPDDLIPNIPSTLQHQLEEIFAQFSRAQFQYKTNKKHSVCYLLTIAKFLQLIDWRRHKQGKEEFGLVKTYAKWLPLQSKDKVHKAAEVINKIFIHNGWVDPLTDKPEPGDNKNPLNTLLDEKVVKFVFPTSNNGDSCKKVKHYINVMY